MLLESVESCDGENWPLQLSPQTNEDGHPVVWAGCQRINSTDVQLWKFSLFSECPKLYTQCGHLKSFPAVLFLNSWQRTSSPVLEKYILSFPLNNGICSLSDEVMYSEHIIMFIKEIFLNVLN